MHVYLYLYLARQKTPECDVPPGFQIKHFGNKGWGVVTTRDIPEGTSLFEYEGDLITWEEGSQREKVYMEEAREKNLAHVDCYMFFIEKGRMCIDATHSKTIGRLLNHSRKNPNLKPKIDPDSDTHCVRFHSTRNIKAGEELLWDYREEDEETLNALPWLRE